MKNHIVKVRGRTGTSSLDLTIPAELAKEYDINAGDLFKVEIKKEDKNELQIVYSLVYKNK